MNIWSVILSPDFLFTSIRVMTPILFAAMACMVFVKGGIDPIGTEGIMLSCALAGPVGGYFTHSAPGGGDIRRPRRSVYGSVLSYNLRSGFQGSRR